MTEGGDHLRDQPVVAVEETGSALVVRLAGDLDLYNAEQVRAALAGAADREPSRVVVDMAQVEFVDSTILGVLIEARRRLPGGALRIAAPQPETRRALAVSGLDRHMHVHELVDEALAAE